MCKGPAQAEHVATRAPPTPSKIIIMCWLVLSSPGMTIGGTPAAAAVPSVVVVSQVVEGVATIPLPNTVGGGGGGGGVRRFSFTSDYYYYYSCTDRKVSWRLQRHFSGRLNLVRPRR